MYKKRSGVLTSITLSDKPIPKLKINKTENYYYFQTVYNLLHVS